MTQQQLPIVEGVASKVDGLLARCDRIHRGSEISRPTTFNDAGQRHARTIAARDAAKTAERLQTSVSPLNSVAE